jgi:hypothetical protein
MNAIPGWQEKTFRGNGAMQLLLFISCQKAKAE